VLGEHGYVIDARVRAVGEREVDEPVTATEGERGLRPGLAQGSQPGAAPAREDVRDRRRFGTGTVRRSEEAWQGLLAGTWTW
jgi:hypothetical protein